MVDDFGGQSLLKQERALSQGTGIASIHSSRGSLGKRHSSSHGQIRSNSQGQIQSNSQSNSSELKYLLPSLCRISSLWHFVLISLMLLGLIVSGCSWLPKINIISDPLSKEEHLELALTYERDGELDIAEREYRAALPLPLASLGLGNVLYQLGESKKAMGYWRQSWQVGHLPAAANNLAWVMLLDGGSLTEAQELAEQAVSLAVSQKLDPAIIANYQSTLNQIKTAISAGLERSSPSE
jgi:tetratricopeptide (TPR) repeat protein